MSAPSSIPLLPKVLGDSNQLLQVCLQLVANCLHVISEQGGGVVTVRTNEHDGTSVLIVATEIDQSAPPPSEPPDSLDPEDGLGLSACQGILQEHRGHIFAPAPRRWRYAASRRTSRHRLRSGKVEGFYGAGDVAISTVRLSWPQAA